MRTKLLTYLAEITVPVILFLLLAILTHNAIHDPDIWLHLKAGEVITLNKAIPKQDIFSFTQQGKPWIDHEWLFQVIAYLVNYKWQADGLIFLQTLVISLAFLVLFIIGHRSSRSYLKSSVLLAVVIYASISRFNIRPDIFSLLFFALYLYILKFHLKSKWIWFLLIVQIIWVNIHGYFFLGPLIVFLFILAEFLRRNIKFLPWQWKEIGELDNHTYRLLNKLFILLLLISFLNPAGWKGILYPLYIFQDILTGRNQIFFKHIQELQSTFRLANLNNLNYFFLLLYLCIITLFINFRRIKLTDLLLFIWLFFFSFKIRNIPFFCFAAYTIILSYPLKSLAGLAKRIKFQRFRYAINIIFIAWLILQINRNLNRVVYDFDTGTVKSQLVDINQSRYPKKAVDFILENKIPVNLFNDFNSGAYLVGRSYPERKVFIDGRTELYGRDFFNRYLDVLNGNTAAFEAITAQYQIGAVLLSMVSTPMPKIAAYLYKNPQWKLVFIDSSAVIFLKNIAVNQDIIKRHQIDLSKYVVPPADLKTIGLRRVYPWPYTNRGFFFDLLEENNPAMQEAKQALRIMPHCAEAFYILGKAYRRKGDYKEAFENLRAAALLFPRYAPAHYELGCLYLTEDKKKAKGELTRALKLAKKGQDQELIKNIEDKLKEIKNVLD